MNLEQEMFRMAIPAKDCDGNRLVVQHSEAVRIAKQYAIEMCEEYKQLLEQNIEIGYTCEPPTAITRISAGINMQRFNDTKLPPELRGKE